MKLISVGDLMFEVVVQPDKIASHGDEALAKIVARPGGQALNVARSFQRMGGEATLISSVGSDDWGAWLQQSLKLDGITLRPQSSPTPTGIVVSIEDEQERTMYTQRGANETLNLEALPIDEWHANEVYVYLSGYLLSTEPGREHSKSLLEGLNEKDIFTVLDTPPVDILRNIGKQKFLQTIGSLCAIFTTIDEGSFLTNHSHVEAVAAHLGELIPLVVIKLGRDGCWVQYDGVGQHVSTHPLNNVGATGAGDAFCGAFLCALSENAPAFEAAKRANEAAGFVIAKRKEA